MKSLSWVPHTFTLEIRRVLSYRIDFWLMLFASLFSKAGLAFFVWREIFTRREVEVIAGYNFEAMMMYYVIAALIYEVNQLDLGFFSQDIYDGTLTKYLIYPLSFLGYKYVLALARAAVHLVQVGIAFIIFYLLIGIPSGLKLTLLSIACGITATLIASYLTFVMAACLDLVSFWVDKVWSLGVMLQLTLQLLGGVYFPIAVFPAEVQGLVKALPFYYAVAFPVKTFFGEVSMPEFASGVALATLWAAGFTVLLSAIWKAGSKQYYAAGQ